MGGEARRDQREDEAEVDSRHVEVERGPFYSHIPVPKSWVSTKMDPQSDTTALTPMSAEMEPQSGKVQRERARLSCDWIESVREQKLIIRLDQLAWL